MKCLGELRYATVHLLFFILTMLVLIVSRRPPLLLFGIYSCVTSVVSFHFRF